VQRLLKELLAALDEAYHRSAEARDLQSRRLFHVKTKKGRSPRNPGFVAAWLKAPPAPRNGRNSTSWLVGRPS